jgi:hypothetical protein
MSRVRKALADLAERLGVNRALLARARRRHRANRRRAFVAHNQAERLDAASDRLRAVGHPKAAAKRSREADRLHTRAYRNSRRAQFWVGRIKVLVQRIEGLEVRQAELEAELKRLAKVTIKGNKAEGGTPGQRWKAVCLAAVRNCSTGRRRNFYSQPGSWDIRHEITPGPEYGERSDCSQFVTGMAWSAGLPDPNGESFTGGYTGTLIREANGWRQVSEAAMRKKGWGFVVYGGGTGYHVEAYIGPGSRTAGHGSAPVDLGVIDLFGTGPSGYRCFIHDPK